MDFRKGKYTIDAIGLIRTIGERYIEKDKDVYAVFVDLEKEFDGVDWKNLMGILKKIGVNWKERRFLSKTNKIQDSTSNVRGKRNWKRGMARMSSVAYTLQHLLRRFNKDCFPNTGGVNIGGRRIKCIRFADDMALLAEDEEGC